MNLDYLGLCLGNLEINVFSNVVSIREIRYQKDQWKLFFTELSCLKKKKQKTFVMSRVSILLGAL